ncbi:hypothetical protein [Persicitalea sp.]|uniref:hypothetical protein n=1 Tax=Persicitalea sp. TaxID=3100273 RepID=UPI003593DCF5
MVLPGIAYQFVNWRDGMKITQSHLSAHDLAICDAIRDTAAVFVNGHNYGLLPAEDGQSAGISVSVMGDTLQLLTCRAITPGGLRVEWNAGADPDSVSLSLLDYRSRLGSVGVFYIVLRISLASLIEAGEYDTEELPLRRPHRVLKPMLELLSPHETIADGYTIPIFRVRFEGQLFSPDYDYIPPTTGVFGENLLWYYETCGKQINSIHQTALLTLRKINGMQNLSGVARDISFIMDRLVLTGLQVLDDYRVIAREQPPVYFITGLVRYARTVRIALDCLPETSLARLYQYMRNNVGGTTKFNRQVPEVTKALMDSMIDSVLTATYDHNDCTLLLDNVKGFLDFTEFVCQSLLALPYVESTTRWDIA